MMDDSASPLLPVLDNLISFRDHFPELDPDVNREGKEFASEICEVHTSTGQTRSSLNGPLLLTPPGQALFDAQPHLPLFRQSCYAR